MPGERRLTSIKALIENTLLKIVQPFVTTTTVANVPLVTKEQQTSLTLTSSVVSVTAASTLVLPANPNRKLLLIQRGTTAGRVFVKFGAVSATVTNGMLFRENAYFTLDQTNIYTGEINAISVGSPKVLYVTEGQ